MLRTQTNSDAQWSNLLDIHDLSSKNWHVHHFTYCVLYTVEHKIFIIKVLLLKAGKTWPGALGVCLCSGGKADKCSQMNGEVKHIQIQSQIQIQITHYSVEIPSLPHRTGSRGDSLLPPCFVKDFSSNNLAW